eukprot:scaffold388_cov244-Pinguiococcus_pyrenoidosus.AAC.16
MSAAFISVCSSSAARFVWRRESAGAGTQAPACDPRALSWSSAAPSADRTSAACQALVATSGAVAWYLRHCCLWSPDESARSTPALGTRQRSRSPAPRRIARLFCSPSGSPASCEAQKARTRECRDAPPLRDLRDTLEVAAPLGRRAAAGSAAAPPRRAGSPTPLSGSRCAAAPAQRLPQMRAFCSAYERLGQVGPTAPCNA